MKARIVAAVSAAALAAVAGYEGLRHRPYMDAVDVPTVCYGHTRNVEQRWYSREECNALLYADLLVAGQGVTRHIRVPLSQPTYDAFASFVYNVGEGAFARSTLVRKANSGDLAGACRELLRWVYAGNKKLPGLEARRKSEHALCVSGL